MPRGNNIIYVGNLPLNVRESEVDKIFYSFGRISKIDLKIPVRPPAYAFIEFEVSQCNQKDYLRMEELKYTTHS